MKNLAETKPYRRFAGEARPTPEADPNAKPLERELASELEAALMRTLDVVSAAMPGESERTAPTEAAASAEAARAQAALPHVADGPTVSAYAPRPKHARTDAAEARPAKVQPPEPPTISRYAPNPDQRRARPVQKAAPQLPAQPSAPPPRRGVAQRPAAANDSEPPDWLTGQDTAFEDWPGDRRRLRTRRPVLALSVLFAFAVGGAAFIAFRPATPSTPDAPAVASVTPAGEPPAPPPPSETTVARAPDPEPAEPAVAVDPPTEISAMAGADLAAEPPQEPTATVITAGAGGDVAALEPAPGTLPARGPEPGTVPASGPADDSPDALALAEPDLRRTNTEALDIVVASTPRKAPAKMKAPMVLSKVTPARPKEAVADTGGATGTATISSSVNLRSGPDNNASAIKVLNAGATVKVVKCNYWCEIIADGKRGFVFQRFLKRAG